MSVLFVTVQSGSLEFLSRQSLDFNKVFRDGQSNCTTGHICHLLHQ